MNYTLMHYSSEHYCIIEIDNNKLQESDNGNHSANKKS